MAILKECPECHKRWALKHRKCPKCGVSFRNPRYYVRVHVGNGQYELKPAGHSLSAAKALEAEIKKLVAERRYTPSKVRGTMTFSEFWRKHYWDYSVKACRNSERWLLRKSEIYEHHLKKVFGNVRLRDITVKMIEEYKARRVSEGAKPGTVNSELAVLKHALGYAVKIEELESNPAKKVSLVRAEERPPYFLSEEEIKRLLEACSPGIRPIVAFMLATGLRRENALKLRWDQVNLKERYLRIPASEYKARRELIIPLSDAALKILKARPRHISSPYVFWHGPEGKPYRGDGFYASFKRAVKRAGLPPHVRVHDLRHTYASLAIKNGVNPIILQHLLGHRTYQMVLRYVHLDQQTKLQEANKIISPDLLEEAL
ncbi:tyrosine-type recombinase/integrase [Thermosulfurimonas dismutans]|uniref:Phage integrase n=1 Tax=Thermosulfurimonas dismutans TaxID=999894 RepID=A0A179D3R0_9BACT|nr:site-specific integrase [Thermosulfurimonas dismutans]OAQ20349.1 Phage integrase [Thermosulfurimonas dismutans]